MLWYRCHAKATPAAFARSMRACARSIRKIMAGKLRGGLQIAARGMEPQCRTHEVENNLHVFRHNQLSFEHCYTQKLSSNRKSVQAPSPVKS